ncbi:hypothetical protein C5471_17265 [Photorhabdus tasmaniensis]|uniref:Ribosome-binding factor A n=1 Tax=Photorhabdus tasmaniensis TaxID=1004159 RepID=A0ABX0GJG4_9GAMM|nr:hypothetical protein [Photorhabdus tasmaniensis]
MIKLNKKQVLKTVKTTVKTLLHQLKPEVKNLLIINLSVKTRKIIIFINAYIPCKKTHKNI